MPSTTDLLKTELGKEFVEARERADRKNMSYRENEIGESVIVAYNPYTLKNQRDGYGQLKFPYAEVISKAFDKMIKETIPENAILSAQFQSWINRERNELMLNSKINRDDYFKEQTNFKTGEVTENYRNDLIEVKMDYLKQQLDIKQKAFRTFMTNSAEKAFANEETLQKYQEYYSSQAEKVSNILKSGDFSFYDKKDKEGNIIKEGTQEDALQHQSNIGAMMDKLDKAQAEQSERVTQSHQNETPDYVGNTLENSQKNFQRYKNH